MFKLRPYQEEAAEVGLNALLYGKKPSIIVISQGGGKSIVIATLAKRLLEVDPNARILVFQPTKEILEANYSKIIGYGVEGVTMFSASVKTKEIGRVTYTTIKSALNKQELFLDFNYVLFDECHLYNSKNENSMYNKFLKFIGNPKCIGLTGTPYRNEGKYVTEKVLRGSKEDFERFYVTQVVTINRIYPFFFGPIVYKKETAELMHEGYLSVPVYDTRFSEFFNYDQLRVKGADFDPEALDDFMNQPDRIKKVVKACLTYSKKSNIKHNLVFCSSITQARKVKELLLTLGETCDMLTSNTSLIDRDRILGRFHSGKIKHLLNVGILIVGYDFPALDCITWARPTLSINMWTQGIGRCFRLDPKLTKKTPIVVDIVGTSKRLGRAELIRIEKEVGDFKDCVVGEFGKISGTPLSKFKTTVKNSKIESQVSKNKTYN